MIEIRDLPEEAMNALTVRARGTGRTLDEFVRELLLREVAAHEAATRGDPRDLIRAGASATSEDVDAMLDVIRARIAADRSQHPTG